jgi:hypothetical protein
MDISLSHIGSMDNLLSFAVMHLSGRSVHETASLHDIPGHSGHRLRYFRMVKIVDVSAEPLSEYLL